MKENMPKIQSPAIILVGAQLGENIGTVARAMLNFGLTDLRLVRPRPDWQVERALKAAAGAQSLIDNRAMFDTVAEATADLGFVVATTARLRGGTAMRTGGTAALSSPIWAGARTGTRSRTFASRLAASLTRRPMRGSTTTSSSRIIWRVRTC